MSFILMAVCYRSLIRLSNSHCESRFWVELGLSRMTQSGHVRSVTVAGPITAFARKADVAYKNWTMTAGGRLTSSQ